MFIISTIVVFLASLYSRLIPRQVCICHQTGNGEDYVPATLDAFRQCGHGGRVAFLNETYHIESVMNTTGLDNCEIDVRGTLLVGCNPGCFSRSDTS